MGPDRHSGRDDDALRDSFVADGASGVVSMPLTAEVERNRFAALADASVEFIGMCDQDFRPLYVNPAGLRMVGLNSLAEAQAARVGDYFFPDDRPLITEEFLPRVAREGNAEIEIRFRHFQTGEAIWMLYNVFSLRSDGGEFLGWATVSRNIHDRKRAEAALRASEQRLRLATQAAGIGAFEWNIQTGENVWTPELEAMYGLQPGEFGRTQRAWERLVHADDRALATGAVQRALETGLPAEAEWRVVWPDGGVHWIRGRFQMFRDERGQPLRLVGVNIDVTADKRAEAARLDFERQLQQTQKLESLGLLAGGIAHDFNNILAGVLCLSDLAYLELPVNSPARKKIGKAIDGVRKAAELTKQMLAYSGKGTFQVLTVDLNPLVEDLMPLLRVSISKKCPLRFDFQKALPAIDADAAQMRQIVMNLVINAAESMDERGGTVSVSTGFRFCDRAYLSSATCDDGLPEGEYVALEVADTGCGMSDETLGKVFDPFFTTKFTGRGLGLSAVLGIVRSHRGAVKVSTKVGRGTTFTILLPASASARAPKPVGDRKNSNWCGYGAVLVIDDEEIVRETAGSCLEKIGFTVSTACDGRDGIDAFRRGAESIRLVLLDLTMPQFDGFEVFEQLRRIRPDTKVILMSGFSEVTVAERFRETSLAGFLQKPFRHGDLVAVVRKAFEEGIGCKPRS